MPIYFREGSPSICPQYSRPMTLLLRGDRARRSRNPDYVSRAKEIIGRMAGGSYTKPLPPATVRGKGKFKFEGGVLMYKGKPFLTCRDVDAANVAGKVFPIVLISAVFELNEARQFPFTRLRSNTGTPGFSTLEQFSSYAVKISSLIEAHLGSKLAKIPALAGHEVKVAVGLDMTNRPILAVDVI